MKKITLLLVFIFISGLVSAQNTDSLNRAMKQLELEMMKKEIEMKQQELILKKQEFEILKQENEFKQEDRKEVKKDKEKRERTAAEKEADRKSRMNKNTVITLKPMALLIGGLDGGIEKKVASRVGLKLMAGYYYTESSLFYRGYYSVGNRGYDNQPYTYTYLNSNNSIQQFKLEIQGRYYASPNLIGLNGVYFGGFLQYKQTTRSDNYTTEHGVPKYISNSYYSYYNYDITYTNFTESKSAVVVVPGVFMGYQLAMSPIAIDFGFGASLCLPVNSFERTLFDVPLLHAYKAGGRPRFNFTIGVPF